MNNFGSQVTNVNGQEVLQQQQMQAQVVNQAHVQQPVVTPQPAQNVQAMFTQEQLNSIISGRINPLNQKIQELNTQLTQAQQLSQSYLNELTSYKNRESATKAGVPAQFVDFAVFEASKLAVNGKSFDDAIKEYVASNGQLFGVSNQNVQTQQTTSPVVQQVTQGVANPAQNIQNQQVVQNSNSVLNNVAQQNNGVSTQVKQSVDGVISQQIANGVANQQNIQYGATSVQLAGNPASVSNIDSQVDAFLRERGLRK